LLVRRDADGEGHHEDGPGGEREAGAQAEDQQEAEQGFEEGDGVAEAQDEAVRERGFGHVLRRRPRKGADAVVDPDQTVAGEVDAEGDPQEGVSEDFVGGDH
jgi:hypothetical protein